MNGFLITAIVLCSLAVICFIIGVVIWIADLFSDLPPIFFIFSFILIMLCLLFAQLDSIFEKKQSSSQIEQQQSVQSQNNCDNVDNCNNSNNENYNYNYNESTTTTYTQPAIGCTCNNCR